MYWWQTYINNWLKYYSTQSVKIGLAVEAGQRLEVSNTLFLSKATQFRTPEPIFIVIAVCQNVRYGVLVFILNRGVDVRARYKKESTARFLQVNNKHFGQHFDIHYVILF